MDNQIFITYFYLPLVIWLALVALLFFFLLKKYTLGDWTADSPNPYAKETLALPRGIFRGILTLTLLFGVIIFELASFQLNRPESFMSEFMVAFQMMIAFYFGSKVMHQAVSSDRKKSADKAQQSVEMVRVGGSAVGAAAYPASSTPAAGGAQGDFYDPESEG